MEKISMEDIRLETQNLTDLFLPIENRAEFIRDKRLGISPSMVGQHLSGHRPISMDAAQKYARAFKRPLQDISPRLAKEALQAQSLLQEPTHINSSADSMEITDAAMSDLIDIVTGYRFANSSERKTMMSLAETAINRARKRTRPRAILNKK